MSGHIVEIECVAFDCSDPERMVAFWQQLVGGEIEREDPHAGLRGGIVPLDFLRVPEGKTVKNRLHLDFRPDDYEAAIEQALTAGATKADDIYHGGKWQVMRDPEHNEFCILKPRQE